MLRFDGKSAKQQSFITSYLDPKTQGWFCVTVIYHLITTLFLLLLLFIKQVRVFVYRKEVGYYTFI